MALHSKKQFADLCGIATNNLSVQIARGKVIVVNDLIDDTLEKNKSFFEKRASKKPANSNQNASSETNTSKISVESVVKLPQNPNELIAPSENQSYTESERQLKYLDTLKRQAEIEKLSLDLAKKKGEVIPSELVKPVFLQHNQSIITEFKNVSDEVIRMFAKKKSLTVNEVAEITGELTSCINNAMNKATNATVNAIDSIVNDFAEKKGVGERNV
jgi:uncharacterized protein YjgD (DUF1641 family)